MDPLSRCPFLVSVFGCSLLCVDRRAMAGRLQAEDAESDVTPLLGSELTEMATAVDAQVIIPPQTNTVNSSE